MAIGPSTPAGGRPRFRRSPARFQTRIRFLDEPDSYFRHLLDD
jgi:hypothetical protein